MPSNEIIALFIDCENVSAKYSEDIFRKVLQRGKLLIKRAYGDFSNNAIKAWNAKSLRHGIKLQHHSSTGKNSTDMHLCIDATEIILAHEQVTAIAIASSDGDFIPLIQKAKEIGLKTYVVATESNTNTKLIQACDEFIELCTSHSKDLPLIQSIISVEQPDEKSETIDKLKQVIKSIACHDGFAPLSKVGQVLKSQLNKTYRELGYSGLAEFIDDCPEHFERSKNYVKLKSPQQQAA